ncbi:9555_t:CDS:1 [Paraglomus occultum]|uniref:9555_t:CDS:1 n=1 Tax=Paraglomus occultum TaxID=144539 RepID=A0A9N8W1S3_9GLOM|nr:9555_t:CDS:1 [Paraglomus occultum]
MLVKFLRFLPKECFEDLEDIVDMHPSLESERSIFNYLNFVRTIKVLDCIHATEYYSSHYLEGTHSSTIAPLLLLRLCQGIITNCPLLAEIDVTGLDRAPSYDDYSWPATSWNLFNLKGNLNRLRRLKFSQKFHPDILHRAATTVTNLESFEFECTWESAYIDGTEWCDAISNFISKQKGLKVARLNLELQNNEMSLQPVWKGLCTQAKTLREIKILFNIQDRDAHDLLEFLGYCTNLHHVEMFCCELRVQSPMKLQSTMFSNLRVLKLEELDTNTYGIGALFKNVKESLDTLSVKRIQNATELWNNVELWIICATNTPYLTNLEIQLSLNVYIPLIQTVLPLWLHLKRLSIAIRGTKQHYELIPKILLLLGQHLPKSVKALVLENSYQLSLDMLVNFLSSCLIDLESISITNNAFDDGFAKALLKYMGHSLKSVFLHGQVTISPEMKTELCRQISEVTIHSVDV